MADTEAMLKKAREAVTSLRDFARMHGMSHFERDPLVAAIHDTLELLTAENARLTEAAVSCNSTLNDWQRSAEAALADRDATITRLRAEHDRHVEWTADEADKDGRDAEIDRLVATIARLREVQAWQPIETMPRNGVEIEAVVRLRWSSWYEVWECRQNGGGWSSIYGHAIEWRPLTPAKEADRGR